MFEVFVAYFDFFTLFMTIWFLFNQYASLKKNAFTYKEIFEGN